jgi:hypothetical protein
MTVYYAPAGVRLFEWKLERVFENQTTRLPVNLDAHIQFAEFAD